MTKFTTSYDRARKLARAVLPSDNVVGIIGAFPDPSVDLDADRLGWTTGTGFDHLAKLGVPTGAAFAEWEDFWWPDDEDDPEAKRWLLRAVYLTWEQVDILLWNQIAQDLGVKPRAPVFAKFVDLAWGVSVYAYDDRGMDVTALNKKPLEELYLQYGSWLLDDDRGRMAAIFES